MMTCNKKCEGCKLIMKCSNYGIQLCHSTPDSDMTKIDGYYKKYKKNEEDGKDEVVLICMNCNDKIKY